VALVRYSAGGAEYQETVNLTSPRNRIGDSVQLLCDPQAPANCRLDSRAGLYWNIGGPAIVGLCCLLAAAGWRWWAALRKLVLPGEAAFGA
jgi:hypothetical protein